MALALYYKHVDSIKVVLANHNVESQRLYSFVSGKRNYIAKLFWYLQYLKLRRFEKLYLKQFDLCVVVSENDKESLTQLCGKMNIKIIPNGVDIKYFRHCNGSIEEGSLIWVGAMNDPYNKDAVDYFLDDIYLLIKNKIPNVKIYFIGKSPTKKLLRFAEKDHRLNIIGYVHDVRPYVAKSSVVVAPIRCEGGTKYKVLNALAQGKAVVTLGAEGINVIHGEIY